MKRNFSVVMVITLMVTAFLAGCSDGGGGGEQGTSITAAATYNQADGSYILADVVNNAGETEGDALITVNGTELSYGIPIIYDGVDLGTIPLYYSDMSFNPGDSLFLSASNPGKAPFYQGSVTVPQAVTLTEPQDGALISEASDINAAWNSAAPPQLYSFLFMGLDTPDYFDEVTTGVSGTVPASSTSAGEAIVGVEAINSASLNDIFGSEESYWIASTYDYHGVTVEPEAQSSQKESLTDKYEEESLRWFNIQEFTSNGIWWRGSTCGVVQFKKDGSVHLKLFFLPQKKSMVIVACYKEGETTPYCKITISHLYKPVGKLYSTTIHAYPNSKILMVRSLQNISPPRYPTVQVLKGTYVYE